MSWAQKFWVPLTVAALAVLGAFLIVATAPSTEYAETERVVPTVRTIPATPTTLRFRVRSQGTVTPRTEADLIPEVSGRVVWKSERFVPGGFFAAGEALLRLERRDFELAVDRARAAVKRSKSERDFAASELERRERLSEAGVASVSQLSDARRAASVAEANWIDARAALEQARRDLERSEITAPFAGRVRSEQVDVGQFLSRGAAVAKLYATDYAEIRLPIPDHQLAFLDLPDTRRAGDALSSEGPAVVLRSRFAGEAHEWHGRIVRTEGEIDPRSRMVHVVARVDDPYALETSVAPALASPGPAARIAEGQAAASPDGRTSASAAARPPLAVGLFVEAEILGPEAQNVIVVPRYAMRDESHMLIVDGEGRLRTQPAQVLRVDRDHVLIQGPLAEGERICVSPLQVVVEGMAVQVVEDEIPAPAAAKQGRS